MSALPQPKPYLTSEEYLALERQAETKSEYWQGETYALAGASTKHTIIGANTLAELVIQLKGRPCTAHTNDLRIKVARAGLYTYPDVAVVCGQAEFEDRSEDTLLNPTVLIEVLSPSTEAYDRGAKFEFYRTLESLTDYLLISQGRPIIEHYTRQPDDHWLLSTYKGLEAVAAIPSIGCELRLADVYDKVTWPAEELRPQSIRAVKEPGESDTTP
jgi:Uma2 family endonuclease